jgi:plastocyanin
VSVRTGSSSLTRRRGAALAVTRALGLLTACGSSDAGSTSAGTSSAAGDTGTGASGSSGAAQAQAQSLTVTEKDFRIHLERTDLAAGEYTITIENQDQATHDLAVERDGATVAKSDTIQPGGSGTLTVTLEPGSYVFYCGVGAHRANGMAVDVDVS